MLAATWIPQPSVAQAEDFLDLGSTIAGSVAEAASALLDLANAIHEAQAYAASIDRELIVARREFFAGYPAVHPEASQRLSQALARKEAYYIARGVSTMAMPASGLPPQLQTLHQSMFPSIEPISPYAAAAWTRFMRDVNTAMRRNFPDLFRNGSTFQAMLRNPASVLNALPNYWASAGQVLDDVRQTSPAYEAYLRLRDWSELLAGGVDLPPTQRMTMWVLANEPLLTVEEAMARLQTAMSAVGEALFREAFDGFHAVSTAMNPSRQRRVEQETLGALGISPYHAGSRKPFGYLLGAKTTDPRIFVWVAASDWLAACRGWDWMPGARCADGWLDSFDRAYGKEAVDLAAQDLMTAPKAAPDTGSGPNFNFMIADPGVLGLGQGPMTIFRAFIGLLPVRDPTAALRWAIDAECRTQAGFLDAGIDGVMGNLASDFGEAELGDMTRGTVEEMHGPGSGRGNQPLLAAVVSRLEDPGIRRAARRSGWPPEWPTNDELTSHYCSGGTRATFEPPPLDETLSNREVADAAMRTLQQPRAQPVDTTTAADWLIYAEHPDLGMTYSYDAASMVRERVSLDGRGGRIRDRYEVWIRASGGAPPDAPYDARRFRYMVTCGSEYSLVEVVYEQGGRDLGRWGFSRGSVGVPATNNGLPPGERETPFGLLMTDLCWSLDTERQLNQLTGFLPQLQIAFRPWGETHPALLAYANLITAWEGHRARGATSAGYLQQARAIRQHIFDAFDRSIGDLEAGLEAWNRRDFDTPAVPASFRRNPTRVRNALQTLRQQREQFALFTEFIR